MVEIIPSINVLTFQEVRERIKKVEPYVLWCHLDVTDGIFSKHLTWSNPADLFLLDTKINVEVHLMVQEPEKIIDQWLIKPIKRLILHLEAITDIHFLLNKCHNAHIELCLAIRPDSSAELLLPWIGKVGMLQLLAVNPGPSGQEMSSAIVDKITYLRGLCATCILEVDGGINKDTAKQAREAGADALVSAAYIFSSPDIQTAINELRGII